MISPSPARRPALRRRTNVVLVVLVIVPIAIALVAGRRIALDRLDSNEVLRLPRTGEFVIDEDRLDTVLAGDLTIPDRLVVAAFCQNGADWEKDFALDLSITVASRPDLVRVAELAAGDVYERDLITWTEQRMLSGHSLEATRADAIAEWGPVAGDYFDARRQPPSADAVDRFTVYATRSSRSRQVFVFLDSRALRGDDMAGIAARSWVARDDVRIAGHQGAVRANSSQCPSLLRPDP